MACRSARGEDRVAGGAHKNARQGLRWCCWLHREGRMKGDLGLVVSCKEGDRWHNGVVRWCCHRDSHGGCRWGCGAHDQIMGGGGGPGVMELIGCLRRKLSCVMWRVLGQEASGMAAREGMGAPGMDAGRDVQARGEEGWGIS